MCDTVSFVGRQNAYLPNIESESVTMSKHSTRKAGAYGKSATIARKARRAAKFATAELDIERIMSTLDRPLVRVA